MTAYSRNSYHALRLVLDSQSYLPQRSISATINAWSNRLASVFNPDTPSGPEPVPTNFLEDNAIDEYESIRSTLLPRDLTPKPIPWPTLFAPRHDKAHASGSTRPRDFDLILYDLVRRKEYDKATQVLQEYQAAGGAPVPHDEYFDVALYHLDTAAPDLDLFLDWLSRTPTYRASYSDKTRDSNQRIARIVNTLRRNHTGDTELIARVLNVFAVRGSLPYAMSDLISQLTLIAPPSYTLKTIRDTIELYQATQISWKVTPELREVERNAVAKHVQTWWNQYTRRLLLTGHKSEANYLFDKMKSSGWDVKADKYTIAKMKLPERSGRMKDDAPPETWLARDLPMPQRIRKFLVNHENPSSRELAQLLRDLESFTPTHPTLVKRFESRFVFRSKSQLNRDWDRRAWKLWKAQMIILRGKGLHHQVVQSFRSRYLWIGLPDHPSLAIPSLETDVPRLPRPSIDDINIVLPSLLALLPTKEAMDTFTKQYLAQAKTLPPSLHPNEPTSAMLVRAHIRQLSVSHGLLCLKNIAKAGFTPGYSAFEAILIAHARSGHSRQTYRYWGKMTRSENFLGKIHMPPPNERTEEALRKIISRYIDEEGGMRMKRDPRRKATRKRLREKTVPGADTPLKNFDTW
ncbi:hypothetical protein DB88DRAFT_497664 [Papiliotrema laurentii]|uniref:Uncharacterized protein n=1 Tax=Papiliotrema laurentii TaxID=5418 RepID=A0AAD9CXL5_PAPLA|nr:hypothetical protein DB88DRAFT_497664 [Papiliotrema laurentii]